MPEKAREPIRVGVWCAYHVTLEACEGIGVFAHNVAMGLAEQSQCAGVDMVCKPGDEEVLAGTVGRGGGKIRAVALPNPTSSGKLSSKLVRSLEKRRFKSEQRLLHARSQTWSNIKQDLFERYSRNSDSKHRAVSGFDAWRLTFATTKRRIAAKTSGKLSKLAIKLQASVINVLHSKSEEFLRTREAAERHIIDQCDVWLIPYVLLDRDIPKPTVVTIHDLVCVHFPEMVTPEALQSILKLASKIGEQSTIAACMSQFIKQTDLIGVLKLPEEKIRVVEPDAPSDFGTPAIKAEYQDEFPVLEQDYIFYPAGFRPYKNHEALVKALAILQEKGNQNLQVVFTGIQAASEELLSLIQHHKLESRIHILGKVSRDVLSLFYQNAKATVVPSLYEQGSYPLMEAMYWGCPIACSNIQSLIERFDILGDAMEFFDPHNAHDLAETLHRLQANNSGIREAQQQQRDKIFGRTAAAAGADWLEVMYSAIERDSQLNGQTQARAA